MDKAKEIISTFIKIDPSAINNNTVMDGSVIPGSLLTHRMYSILSNENYHIENPEQIKTYGDFLNAMGGGSSDQGIETSQDEIKKQPIVKHIEYSSGNIQVGIDIEDIINMPIADDYREDRFYTDNFSPKEISYCILQADPRASFTGRFAAKEAIIKADNAFKTTPFTEIEILNNKAGKPIFQNFSLSISHATEQAIAIAIKGEADRASPPISKKTMTVDEITKLIQSSLPKQQVMKQRNKLNYFSLIISFIALGLVLYI